MELDRLIDALSRPEAYPYPVAAVEVRHTHISVVFLAGDRAFKVKKPVALGFLDFSTRDRRRHFCEEEVRLNRRLAPSVYRGVVPVTRAGDRVRLGGQGEIVEWAVEMERLPDEAQLEQYVLRGAADAGRLADLGRRLASFHAGADRGPRIAAAGRFEVVAANARDNFLQSAAHVGVTLGRAVHERLRERTEQALERLRPLIESRAARGVPCDTHGDLHLEHVYLFPQHPPPDDLLIVDCIEFNERLRFADPVADMAFLVMDLLFHGRADLAGAFRDAYFQAAGDDEGRMLLPFYTAYRAAVRGKVEGIAWSEAEVPAAERAAARQRGRAHWLLALSQLEEPGRRPCLVLATGLPGTGKSSLARGLAAHAGFQVLRSDAVRKDLAGVGDGPAAEETFGGGIYSPAWNERTYTECLRRAEGLLFEGRRVVVDASFREEARRAAFIETARRWGVPALGLVCQAAPDTVRARLAQRHGDVSDADWSIYLEAAARWEEPGPATRPYLHPLSTEGDPGEVLGRALALLREAGLAAST
jgi:aminoglycoside phosphotransferase family enzyme/predicted kinase